jgi:hypothetical protein
MDLIDLADQELPKAASDAVGRHIAAAMDASKSSDVVDLAMSSRPVRRPRQA